MALQLSIPESIVESVRARLGARFEQKTREDLAIQWRREGIITSGQVAEMLGITWFEAESFLKSRNVGQGLSAEEVISDAHTLKESRQR